MPTLAPHPDAPPPSAAERPSRWPLERFLFLLAGTFTGASVLLGVLLSPWFLILAGLVAVNQLVFVAVGECPASLVLGRGFGVQRGCPR